MKSNPVERLPVNNHGISQDYYTELQSIRTTSRVARIISSSPLCLQEKKEVLMASAV